MQLECPINFRGCCKSQEPLERKNNPPNGSLAMIQDQPSAGQCGLWNNVRHWFACHNRLDLKYPQTAVCGILQEPL